MLFSLLFAFRLFFARFRSFCGSFVTSNSFEIVS